MTLHLGWPQIILITLSIVGLILSAAQHGKPRKPESFWTQLAALAITYPLLIWGGFFR